MIKIDLITGFLGAGKTTFLKKYAKYLLKQGERICILENDYGAINVDMMLLSDLEAAGCDLEMVSGGCHVDCHRRRFKTKLIAMGMSGYDRVLVEPSGIFDTDEFFDALYEEPLDRWYEVGNVITIVNARLPEELSPESEYVLAAEAANAGMIVLSRTQEASPEEISGTIAHLNRALASIRCRRTVDDVIISEDWESLTAQDFARIAASGYHRASYVKKLVPEDKIYDSLFYFGIRPDPEELASAIEQVFQDASCGNVIRVKGFYPVSGSIRASEGKDWMELNATADTIQIRPIGTGQEVIIIIGEHMDKSKLDGYFQKWIDKKED